MHFIQHLIESSATTSDKLLEVNSKDFLNVLLEAAGEELLSAEEVSHLPSKMTVGKLINMYEARGLPPKMNYQFDEVDPKVDKNSFRDANKERRMRNRENDKPEYSRADQQREYDRRWGGPSAEERLEHQMMHGTEEEESNMPATRDRKMGQIRNNGQMYNNMNNAKNYKHNNKRADQQTTRYRRSMLGDTFTKRFDTEEEEQKVNKNMSAAARRGYDDGRSGVKFKFDKSPAYNRGYEQGEKSKG